MGYNLYSRFSRDGSRRINNVQLGVQGILLCDGGYSATINKDQQPGRPSQCSNYAKDKIQSRSFGDSGKGAISIKIETANGGTIGCESYVIIGFDAKVNKIENAFWPIKTVKKLNKQLDVCTGNNNGCDGFFWRLEFDNTQAGFTRSAQQQLQFEIRYTGSSSHVSVATMQYNCIVGTSCGLAQPNNRDNQTSQANPTTITINPVNLVKTTNKTNIITKTNKQQGQQQGQHDITDCGNDVIGCATDTATNIGNAVADGANNIIEGVSDIENNVGDAFNQLIG